MGEKRSMSDIKGQTFGYLTALEPLEKWESGDVLWRCRCVCGREIEVTASRLLKWNVTNCGCKVVVRGKPRNLAGQKFGKLTVLYPTEERRRKSAVWHCQCDCGGVKDVAVDRLREPGERSCGCVWKRKRKEEG